MEHEHDSAAAGGILVLGAYGLIGFAIARRLQAEGHRVIALGRDARVARRVIPDLPFVQRDVAMLRDAADWAPLLRGVSVVVNCSGALQDGPRDDLEALHHHAVAALAGACAAGDVGLIQISALGARPGSGLAFLASKGRGDAAIRRSGARHHLFRPGLVLAQSAYGGTAMLRMLAAVPLVQPLALPGARIQTVALPDVTAAVSAAVRGDIPPGTEADLAETGAHDLRDLVAAIRDWLGFAPARRVIVLPDALLGPVAAVADGLGRLGWRSPLRSTAFGVLREGVLARPGDGAPPAPPPGLPPALSLRQTLAAMPARAEDRLFARMLLLMPLTVATLCLFWLVSGVIGLLRIDRAALVLTGAGWPQGLALASVAVWALVDIAIAAALAIRRLAPAACWAAVVVSLVYLAASTLVVPHLWADPLGPLVKVVPSMVLALLARAALETR